MLDRLLGKELQADLGSAVIGREIIVLEQTGSTNDAILQVATADSNEGLVLFAEHQTAGRGQHGRRRTAGAPRAARALGRRNPRHARAAGRGHAAGTVVVNGEW